MKKVTIDPNKARSVLKIAASDPRLKKILGKVVGSKAAIQSLANRILHGK